MKKILFSLLAALAMTFSGCKDLPSADTIGNLSKSIGYAAGVACNLGNISQGCRKTLVEVLDIVGEVIPGTNETFAAAWGAVAKKTVDKFVEEGKIDKGEGDLIVLSINVAAHGVDYMFDVRWPKAKQYKDLVSAGTKGFVEGFKSVIQNSIKATDKFPYDKEEFERATEYFGKTMKSV